MSEELKKGKSGIAGNVIGVPVLEIITKDDQSYRIAMDEYFVWEAAIKKGIGTENKNLLKP